MHRLMLQGVGAAEAARAATETDVDQLPGADQPLRPGPPAAGPRGRRARPGGGRVLATREAGPAARGLARAAMSLDSDACTALLRTSLARSGVVGTWNDVLLPVLAGVGDRWRSTGARGRGRAPAQRVRRGGAARAVTDPGGPARNARPVLLAALEPEDHRLPLVALAAALAERRIATRPLGARLPARALVDAVSRTGALAVFLWSQGAAGPGRLPDEDALQAVRPPPVLLLGGPGWDAERGRPGVTVCADLESAVGAVVALVSGRVPAR